MRDVKSACAVVVPPQEVRAGWSPPRVTLGGGHGLDSARLTAGSEAPSTLIDAERKSLRFTAHTPFSNQKVATRDRRLSGFRSEGIARAQISDDKKVYYRA